MQPLRIGVVGAGGIAQRNAREAAGCGVATIAGVTDVNHGAARQMSKALKVPAFGSLEQMLDAPDVDAVLLCVPHHLHAPMAIQAAESGKHVLVEKPMANTLADAEAMSKACRRNDVLLSVNYSFRFLPRIQQAKAIVDEGALGEVHGIQIINHQYKDPGYWTGGRSNSPDDWRASKTKSGGGCLIMNVCHVIDYLYFITGRSVVRTYAEYDTLGTKAEVEDCIGINGRLDNGGLWSIAASSTMRGADQCEERVWGSHGTLILNGDGLAFYSKRPILGKRPGRLHRISRFPKSSWTAEWVKDFAHAARESRRPAISDQDGIANLAFIETAYQSMSEGKPEAVPGSERERLRRVAQ